MLVKKNKVRYVRDKDMVVWTFMFYDKISGEYYKNIACTVKTNIPNIEEGGLYLYDTEEKDHQIWRLENIQRVFKKRISLVLVRCRIPIGSWWLEFGSSIRASKVILEEVIACKI